MNDILPLTKTNIVNLFSDAKHNKTFVKTCAPMVRYSKIQFRTLIRNFGVDLCFTPMIMADSFCQNEKARINELSTTTTDSPTIVQFAANNPNDFVDAAILVYPYSDGVDLNCGCPQRWAMKEGYGCALLTKPEIIYDMVKQLKNAVDSNFSVSVKIRLLKDLNKTVEMCRQLEKSGVTFLTVHGRTPTQGSGESIDVKALKLACDSVSIPIIANGGIKTLGDAEYLYEVVNCGGVMAASGILSNPALFSGANCTPVSCIKMWKHLKDQNIDKITFQCYHHHLVFMLDKVLTKQEKNFFNSLNTFKSVDEYLQKNVVRLYDDELEIKHELGEFVTCHYDDKITMKHSRKCRGCGKSINFCVCCNYDYNNRDGKYFSSFLKEDESDFMESNLFDEVGPT